MPKPLPRTRAAVTTGCQMKSGHVTATNQECAHKVEYTFHVMKHQFGFTRVCYRGLNKNAHFLFVNCALINPVMTRKRILLISPVRCT